MIMPYLSDLINDHRAIRNESNEWKIQLNMSVNFISFNDTEEIRTFLVWSDNEEIRSGIEANDIINFFLILLFFFGSFSHMQHLLFDQGI